MLTPLLLLVCMCSDPADSTIFIDRDPAARQPQVVLDGSGRVYVTYGAGTEIRCATSTDAGRSFSKPVVVAIVPKLALGMRRGPRIAVSNRAVVIAAVGCDDDESDPSPVSKSTTAKHHQSPSGNVMAWRSVDWGKTWSGPVRLNTVSDSAREGLHALAARPDGTFFCVWLDMRTGSMSLSGAQSTDHGATWQRDLLVYQSPEKAICTCCHPSAAFTPEGTLLILFRNDLAGARDMYFSTSIERESRPTFATATKLGKRTWILDKCPMDGGAIATGSSEKPTTVWTRADSVYSCEPGEPEQLLGQGVQPWAASGPDGTYVVWLTRRAGTLMYLEPNAKEPSPFALSALDPVIASAPGGRAPVVAAWESTSDPRGIALHVVLPRR